MAFFVESVVVWNGVFAFLARRDAGEDAALGERLAKPVRVVTAIREGYRSLRNGGVANFSVSTRRWAWRGHERRRRLSP